MTTRTPIFTVGAEGLTDAQRRSALDTLEGERAVVSIALTSRIGRGPRFHHRTWSFAAGVEWTEARRVTARLRALGLDAWWRGQDPG